MGLHWQGCYNYYLQRVGQINCFSQWTDELNDQNTDEVPDDEDLNDSAECTGLCYASEMEELARRMKEMEEKVDGSPVWCIFFILFYI